MQKKHSLKSQHIATRLRQAGRDSSRWGGAVNPPLIRASTVLFESVQELQAAEAQPFDHFFYGRFGTPTHFALAEAMCDLAGAASCVFYPSGLAAAAGCLLSLLNAGEELLLVDCVYGPTRKLCQEELTRFGIRTRMIPATCGADIAEYIGPDTRAIYCESPGSLTMEMQDLPALCAVARQHDIPVLVDNTWATPLNARVLEMGASVDIQAATKYLGGHADMMMGLALCDERIGARIQSRSQSFGYCVSADDAWQCLRGLRTLDIRLQQHQQQAAGLKQWLRDQPEVQQILDPSDSQHPQHWLWQRDFQGGNGLFSVRLKKLSDAQLSTLVDQLEHFGLGYSWGGYESLCVPFDVSGSRAAGPFDGSSSYLRFHAGFEHLEDLLADLQQAFEKMRAL